MSSELEPWSECDLDHSRSGMDRIILEGAYGKEAP